MSRVIICNIIIFYTEGDCLISKFDEVYEIMKESFPVDEFREYKEQKKLLSRPNYFLKTTLHHDEVTAFCAYYEFDDFIYIEHLACTEKVRGQGIGTQLIRDVMLEAKQRPIILEVEPPVDILTKRRVEFYKRLGFILNDIPHYQPPLNLTTGTVELRIMSSCQLGDERLRKYSQILNTEVYGVEEDFKL